LVNNEKKRVFQVAREFNVSTEALIAFLSKLNFSIRNHMTLVTDDMYEEISKKYTREVDVSDKDFDFKRKLKEKRVREEEKKIEAQRKYEEKVRTSIRIMSEKPLVQRAVSKYGKPELPPDETGIQEEISVIEPEQPIIESTIEEEIPELSEAEIFEKEDKKKILADAEQAVQELIARKITDTKPISMVKPKAEAEKIQPRHPEGSVSAPEIPVIEEKKEEIKDEKRERDLQVIKKISETKAAKREETVDELARKKAARKKLKAKDRVTVPERPSEEETEVKKKKRKKKKRVRLVEFDEATEGKVTEFKRDKFRKKTKKRKKIQISDEEVEKSIKQTLSIMEDSGKAKKRRKKVRVEEDVAMEDTNILRVHEYISTGELALEMGVEPSEVIKKCLELGTLVSINQRLDEETIVAVADEFGFEIEIVPEFGSEIFEEIEEKDEEQYATARPPVVTIMGHVDHGKTSLLDYIRKSNITDHESGGITQHIGAYEVNVNGKSITFLDTPGHEAFAAMRARGAQVTDIVILVVAADDNVMPQTIEAINHAKAAEVPIVVAINKIDKSNANPETIKKQLADRDVLVESWGGKYQAVEISAKTGVGVEKLLESIIVESEILELKANADRLARGVVIESRLDKGKGVVATVLIQKGRLNIGDPFISGQYSGKVRGLYNDKGIKTREAGPSQAVMVLGFSGIPQAGDTFIVLESEKDTKEISLRRQQIKRELEFRKTKHITLDEISRRIKEGQVRELSIILKGDVDGSVEAIGDSLKKLSNNEVAVNIIHEGVGAISESDVLLASASNAVIIGFQVRPTLKAREIAAREKVDIRLYTIIYEAISEVKDALEGLLEPEHEERNLSVIEVREIFRVPKIGTVAGCYVVSGKVSRNEKARLFRNDKLIYDGKISSLKRFKEDIKEVVNGFECGIGLENFDDIRVSDIIETYKVEEIKRTLTVQK